MNSNLRGRVGLFGGTFSPLHNAHLKVALTAMEQCGLSEIVFIPNGIPPHKQVESGVRKEDRLHMVQLAVRDLPNCSVSRIEIDRDGPSYTIDTIRALKDDYPQGICFIVGADRLLELSTWREPEALLRSVPFVIAPRSGVCLDAFDVTPYENAQIVPLEMEEVDLSSSAMRERIHQGLPIDVEVPAAVVEYIRKHGLYQGTMTGSKSLEQGG